MEEKREGDDDLMEEEVERKSEVVEDANPAAAEEVEVVRLLAGAAATDEIGRAHV